MNIKWTDRVVQNEHTTSQRGRHFDSNHGFEQCLLSCGPYPSDEPSSVASRSLLPQAGEGSSLDENRYQNYYWHHQNQLQPSALTFKAIELEKKSSTPLDIHTTQAPTMPSIKTTDAALRQTTSVRITIETPQQASTTQPGILIESFVEHIEARINAQPNALEPKINQAIARQDKAIRVQSRPIAPPSALKNHHVFIDESCIELTLNTRALSSHVANTLQKTIKQWLVQNGYALKTLIINGVKQ